MSSKLEIAIVFACTVVGGFFYAATMNENSLRTDEFGSLITARRPLVESFLQQEDYAAPLYQLLLRTYVDRDDPPVWLVRLPAVVAAVLCLPAVWWLGRLLFGRRVGLLAMPLLGISVVFLFHARDARPYSLFVLFSILSMACYWRLLEQGGLWRWIAYVASTAALCYSHYYGFLCLPAQAMFAVLQFGFHRDLGRSSLRGLMGIAAASVLVLPALGLALRYVFAGVPLFTDDWIRRPRFFQLLTGWHVSELFRSPVLGPLWLGACVALFWDKAPFCQAEAAPNAGSWWDRRRAAVFCLLWIGFGLYFPLCIAWLLHPVYRVSYGTPMIVPVVLLTLAGLQRASRWWTAVFAAAIVVATLSAKSFLLWQGFPDVVTWVQKDNDPRTPVSVVDWGYCENWKNLEECGLIYYGLPADRIELLPVKFPFGPGLRDGASVPSGRRSLIVGHILFRKTVEEYLRESGRSFETHLFDTLFLLDVAPKLAETGQRWN